MIGVGPIGSITAPGLARYGVRRAGFGDGQQLSPALRAGDVLLAGTASGVGKADEDVKTRVSRLDGLRSMVTARQQGRIWSESHE